jgi:uncharacterized protein YdiU (UPF0061 family)
MELPVNVAEGGIDNSGRIEGGALPEPLRPAFYDEDQASAPEAASRLAGWLRRYSDRVRLEKEPTVLRYQRMSQANPKYVLRNYLAQQAIEGLERGDGSVMARLMDVLRRPYDEQPEHEELAGRRPEWARNKAGCSALSCSS